VQNIDAFISTSEAQVKPVKPTQTNFGTKRRAVFQVFALELPGRRRANLPYGTSTTSIDRRSNTTTTEGRGLILSLTKNKSFDQQQTDHKQTSTVPDKTQTKHGIFGRTIKVKSQHRP